MQMMVLLNVLALCFQIFAFGSELESHKASNAELQAIFDASLDEVGAQTRRNAEDLWVHSLMDRFPELRWYAQEGVAVSQEGVAKERPDSFSVRTFGRYYPEFDRTVMVLKCFFLIQSDSKHAYETFVRPQKENTLTREHYDVLHNRVVGFVGIKGSENNVDELLAALVLGDVGKLEAVRVWMERYGIRDLDHDVFYGSIMQSPEARQVFPSFAILSEGAQQLLIDTANLGHWGHITHLEGGVSMFTPLKESGILESNPRAFTFESIVHTCDVAGAAGHRDVRGSLVYNDDTFWALEQVYDACESLANHSERYAYNAYLSTRANRVKLPIYGEEREVLGRLAAMLRLYDVSDGELLYAAAQKWTPQQRTLVLNNLTIHGADRFSETPTYIPAFLVNMFNHRGLGFTDAERLNVVVAEGVPWVASVLDAYADLLESGSMDPSIPLNFNEAAGQVKENPHFISRKRWRIDRENGSVGFL